MHRNRRLLLHRAVNRGEVLRLTRGAYCLAEPYRKSHSHPFAVAAFLCFPSHVSLESALAHHDLIPEAVYGVTSATLQRSREYDTPLGHFTYVRIPTDDPTVGAELRQAGVEVGKHRPAASCPTRDRAALGAARQPDPSTVLL